MKKLMFAICYKPTEDFPTGRGIGYWRLFEKQEDAEKWLADLPLPEKYHVVETDGAIIPTYPERTKQ